MRIGHERTCLRHRQPHRQIHLLHSGRIDPFDSVGAVAFGGVEQCEFLPGNRLGRRQQFLGDRPENGVFSEFPGVCKQLLQQRHPFSGVAVFVVLA